MQHVLVLGDQLTTRHGPLATAMPGKTRVLMIEATSHAKRLPFHKQKLALVYSAMRHFRLELESLGFLVSYQQCQSFDDGIGQHLMQHPGATISFMQPADHGVAQMLETSIENAGGHANIVPNDLWLVSDAVFDGWSNGKKTMRMELFYRRMREHTGWLMDNGKPLGGVWNFDSDNRQTPSKNHLFPPTLVFEPDALTTETLAWVEANFVDHFGTLEGFNWPVTRAQALQALEHFLEHRLALFGPFEDAMVANERQLYHSFLSPALNLGLISAQEVCLHALTHAKKTNTPLQSIEGFVRQVLGWREFMHHVYRHAMPGLRQANALGHQRDLPALYWTGKTQMRCLSHTIQKLLETGHTHHIERLMVLGNFALLTGVLPQAINDWFLLAYIDAFDWVVTPNVIGMSQFADGGAFTSKPYAAGGAYINKMSDHCQACAFNPKKSVGEDACPFNALYWHFIDRHEGSLRNNQRMSVIVANWRKRDPSDKAAILAQAQKNLQKLEQNNL